MEARSQVDTDVQETQQRIDQQVSRLGTDFDRQNILVAQKMALMEQISQTDLKVLQATAAENHGALKQDINNSLEFFSNEATTRLNELTVGHQNSTQLMLEKLETAISDAKRAKTSLESKFIDIKKENNQLHGMLQEAV